ncbi:nitroreductase family protein [Thermoanaerobacter sp. X514]|uniref:nitroreductase family protein n=1 Tax=Thermoanaerobacter sp. (strain X514) TaxID=399726 RepID=UPI0000E1DF14|nr:nitroreductase family protein [Thermoanaerobacter sp. X514]ABY91465.1 nitroreductase [Thermoanaerobacter sp. X514]
MNEVINAIKSRRSIRRFKPEQVRDEEIEAIIEAAIHAPSGHNEQPWHFTVIQNKDLIDHFSNVTKKAMAESKVPWIAALGKNEKLHLFYNAPTVIVVSGKKGSYSPLIDCSAATQNMLLAAHSLGLGACWIGLINLIFKMEEEVKKLSLPHGYEPYFAVALGYPDLEKPPRPIERKKDVVNYIK